MKQRWCHCSRSEEHTSELQSLRHLVCRLLLDKKEALRTERADVRRRGTAGHRGGRSAARACVLASFHHGQGPSGLGAPTAFDFFFFKYAGPPGTAPSSPHGSPPV